MYTTAVGRKTVPLSVRVSDDDAAFLASLEIAGATTPSEKLRALLGEARRRAEGLEDEGAGAESFKAALRPPERRVRAAESAVGMRSDLARKLYDRVPELMASLASGVAAGAKSAELVQFEDRLAIQAYALVEELLELGSASANRAYDPNRLSKRVAPALAVVARVKPTAVRRKGHSNE